jgi:hypothetical protein
MDRLANGGLRYTQFYTTALCSPHECVTADRPQPHHCWHGPSAAAGGKHSWMRTSTPLQARKSGQHGRESPEKADDTGTWIRYLSHFIILRFYPILDFNPFRLVNGA